MHRTRRRNAHARSLGRSPRALGATHGVFGGVARALLISLLVALMPADSRAGETRRGAEEEPPAPLPGSDSKTPSELFLVPAFPGAEALQLRLDTEILPAAGLEDGGEVTLVRPGLRLRAALPLSSRITFQAVARYAATFYEFEGNQDFFDDPALRSSDPFGDLHDAGLNLQAALKLNDSGQLLLDGERWSLLTELFGAARWEQGAFDDGLLGGGGLALGYELPGHFQLALGVSLRSQIAQSGVGIDPIFSARWRVTKDLTLRTRGRGGQIEYAWSKRLTTYAAVFRTGQSWRLDGRPGVPSSSVLNDTQLRCGVGFEWRVHKQLRLHLEAGAVAQRELEVDVRRGGRLSRLDGNASGYLVLSLDLRP